MGFLWQHGQPDDQLWLTETGCLYATAGTCGATNFMYRYTGRITEWLNNEGRWVDRYAWFVDWDAGPWEPSKLFDVTPTPGTYNFGEVTLTPPLPSALGDFYSHVTPNAPIPLPWPTVYLYMPAVIVDPTHTPTPTPTP